MTQRNDDLVRFVSRTFLAAGVAIVVGLGVLVTLFWVRAADEQQARRSREIGRLARELEITALARQSSTSGTVDARRTAEQLDSLRRMTAAVPAQRARAERIASAMAQWDSAAAAEAQALLAAEDQRYDERLREAHRLDQILIGSTALAVAVILATLFLLRRRLLSQARDQAIATASLDLRNAQLIDQTRQMEQVIDELQASETRFRTLVHSLHDVVFTLGREKRFTGMFGGRSSSDPDAYRGFIGRTATEIVGPEIGKAHTDAADRALAGETVSYEWSMEGHHYVNTVSPLRGPSGEIRGVVGINRNVTAQVDRERALSEAREQLRQAQRLEALGQLAGGVAHDFNNLLTVIMTYAAILREEAEPNSDAARSIEEIQVATDRAAALTRQLLAFGRRQMLQPRPADLNETVREVERMLRRVLPPDVVVETSLAPSLSLVMADPGQIEQVLVNLAINARDAMPDGGRLSISTSNVGRDEGGMEGPHVLVTVRDTGVGMSAEMLSRIFEPFFTTKSVGKGTGLGLATAHGIIEQSGGRVSVESQPGRGTAFFIRLPQHVADPALVVESSVTPASGGSETILLVDDNEELRRVVKRMLVRAGYEVLEASTGAAALAQLDRGTPVDAVLSDVMMPDMNGRAVMEAIQQRHRHVRLLLMSGYNYDVALRGMAQRGDVAFIEKPFTAEKLLRRLRDVLTQTEGQGAA